MKASDVFDLPAYSFGRIVADNLSAGGVGSFDSADMAKVAANCINHADALADALESIIGLVNASCEDELQDFYLARGALAAYRGAK